MSFAQPEPQWKTQWDKTVSAAKREGRVVVFGPPGELIGKALTEGFNKLFPEITVEYSGGRPAEQGTRLKAERDGGVYSVDIMFGGTVTMMEMASYGALDPIEPILILPEVRNPGSWRDGRLEFTNPVSRLALVFSNQLYPPVVYNEKQVKAQEIDELYELVDPKWKGKFVINDPLVAGSGSAVFHWLWRVLGADKASDFFRKLRAQAGALDRDQRRQIEWVFQGKYAWLFAPNSNIMQQLIQRGLRFGILPDFKDYGGLIGTGSGSMALLNRAPHRNAAVVYINWLLGKEAQSAWSRILYQYPRRLDVPTDHLPAYLVLKPGGQYFFSYYEKDVPRTPQEEAVLKELFGR